MQTLFVRSNFKNCHLPTSSFCIPPILPLHVLYQESRKSKGQPAAATRTSPTDVPTSSEVDTVHAAFPAHFHPKLGIGITKFANIFKGNALAHSEVQLQFMEFYLTHHTKSTLIYSRTSIFFFFKWNIYNRKKPQSVKLYTFLHDHKRALQGVH